MAAPALSALASLTILFPALGHAATGQACPPGLSSAAPSIAACGAAEPDEGRVVSGPVLQVIDGQTLCVGLGPLPSQWVRVHLDNASADGSRSALMAAAFAETIDCRVTRKTGGTVIADCSRDGVPLSQLMQTPAVRIQAAAWR
jgi:hypothetical protein